MAAPSGKRVENKLHHVDKETVEVEYMPREAGKSGLRIDWFVILA